jgi:hypothetical protein
VSPCRGCQRPIAWVAMKGSGRAMPCDPEVLEEYLVPEAEVPDAAAELGEEWKNSALTWVTLVTEDGELVRGVRVRPFAPFVRRVVGRVSHFATCEQAARFRRR